MKTSRWIVAVALLSGCAQDQTQAPPAGTASATPNAVPVAPVSANPETTPAVPTPKVSSNAGVAPATPAKPVPERVRLNVPAGTLLPIELQTTISSDSSRVGDTVLAELTEDVPLEGFKLDRGAEVRGRVLTVVAAKRVKGRARLVFAFDAVMKSGEKLSIETEAVDTSAKSTSSKDKKIIAGGALGGLIVGALKDGKKGAAIGTVIGAAAGGGTVMVMKGDEVELPRGAKFTVEVK